MNDPLPLAMTISIVIAALVLGAWFFTFINDRRRRLEEGHSAKDYAGSYSAQRQELAEQSMQEPIGVHLNSVLCTKSGIVGLCVEELSDAFRKKSFRLEWLEWRDGFGQMSAGWFGLGEIDWLRSACDRSLDQPSHIRARHAYLDGPSAFAPAVFSTTGETTMEMRDLQLGQNLTTKTGNTGTCTHDGTDHGGRIYLVEWVTADGTPVSRWYRDPEIDWLSTAVGGAVGGAGDEHEQVGDAAA